MVRLDTQLLPAVNETPVYHDRSSFSPTGAQLGPNDSGFYAIDADLLHVINSEQFEAARAYFDKAIWPQAEECIKRAEAIFREAEGLGSKIDAELHSHYPAKIDAERTKFSAVVVKDFFEALIDRGLVPQSKMAPLLHVQHCAQKFFVSLGITLNPSFRKLDTPSILSGERNQTYDLKNERKKSLATAEDFHDALRKCFFDVSNDHIAWMTKELGRLLKDKMASPRAVSKDISFKLNIAPDVEVALDVRDAPLLLDAVVGELLLNAIDAAPDVNGKVGLAVKHQDGLLYFKVTNNGSRIPEDLLPRVFEPFVTTKKDGTGSGLPILLSIVKSMGGKIEVTSNDEETRFIVAVPFRFTAQTQKGAAA